MIFDFFGSDLIWIIRNDWKCHRHPLFQTEFSKWSLSMSLKYSEILKNPNNIGRNMEPNTLRMFAVWCQFSQDTICHLRGNSICTNICQCCALLPRGNRCPSEQPIDKDGDSSYVFNFPASCWSIGQSMGESVAFLKMTSESSVLDAFDHDYCYNHDQWPQSWPLLWVTRMMAFEYGLEKVID